MIYFNTTIINDTFCVTESHFVSSFTTKNDCQVHLRRNSFPRIFPCLTRGGGEYASPVEFLKRYFLRFEDTLHQNTIVANCMCMCFTVPRQVHSSLCSPPPPPLPWRHRCDVQSNGSNIKEYPKTLALCTNMQDWFERIIRTYFKHI